MSVYSRSASAQAARIEALALDARRLREFATQLRDEAVGVWAEDYVALAELEDAKAAALEAELSALSAPPASVVTAPPPGP